MNSRLKPKASRSARLKPVIDPTPAPAPSQSEVWTKKRLPSFKRIRTEPQLPPLYPPDSRHFSRPRQQYKWAYSLEPAIRPLMLFELRCGPPRSGRDVSLSSGLRVELWSPNSEQLPFYPGVPNPFFTLAMPLKTSDRFQDGHWGRFDPIISPQYFNQAAPWWPFLRRACKVEKTDAAFAAYEPLTAVWRSLDASTGCVPPEYVERLKNLVGIMQSTIDNLPVNSVQEKCPQFPSQVDIHALSGVRRWEEAVDIGSSLQRAVREVEAWIVYTQKYSKPSLKQMTSTSIAPADEQYIGLWINGMEEKDALSYLTARVPCFVVHSYRNGEVTRSAAGGGQVFSNFVVGTDLDGFPTPYEKDLRPSSFADPQTSHFGSSIFGTPEQEAWSASAHVRDLPPWGPEFLPAPGPKGSHYEPPPFNEVEIDPDRLPWISPPPIMKAPIHLRGAWRNYQMQNVGGVLAFLYRSKIQPNQGQKKWYDRKMKRVFLCPANMQIPRGVVSDRRFGAPAPPVPFMIRSNAAGVGEFFRVEQYSSWMYPTEAPILGDIGKKAPRPRPDDLPLKLVPNTAAGVLNCGHDNDDDDDDDEDHTEGLDPYIRVPALDVLRVSGIPKGLAAGEIAGRLSDAVWQLRIVLRGVACSQGDVMLKFNLAEAALKARGLLCAENSLDLGSELEAEYCSVEAYDQFLQSSVSAWTPPNLLQSSPPPSQLVKSAMACQSSAGCSTRFPESLPQSTPSGGEDAERPGPELVETMSIDPLEVPSVEMLAPRDTHASISSPPMSPAQKPPRTEGEEPEIPSPHPSVLAESGSPLLQEQASCDALPQSFATWPPTADSLSRREDAERPGTELVEAMSIDPLEVPGVEMLAPRDTHASISSPPLSPAQKAPRTEGEEPEIPSPHPSVLAESGSPLLQEQASCDVEMRPWTSPEVDISLPSYESNPTVETHSDSNSPKRPAPADEEMSFVPLEQPRGVEKSVPSAPDHHQSGLANIIPLPPIPNAMSASSFLDNRNGQYSQTEGIDLRDGRGNGRGRNVREAGPESKRARSDREHQYRDSYDPSRYPGSARNPNRSLNASPSAHRALGARGLPSYRDERREGESGATRKKRTQRGARRGKLTALKAEQLVDHKRWKETESIMNTATVDGNVSKDD